MFEKKFTIIKLSKNLETIEKHFSILFGIQNMNNGNNFLFLSNKGKNALKNCTVRNNVADFHETFQVRFSSMAPT